MYRLQTPKPRHDIRKLPISLDRLNLNKPSDAKHFSILNAICGYNQNGIM